ncbi:hypothetical protein PYCCODRAFT_32020 [Trametes coccinea BRFM310]|uniref:Uncharacterized protein n=1 Tax=Trametes coccinea (strain BRFM310) TaxID=1353009 RepID=A0A1Y2J588_TRAC3|nr:hypothetical protein PYCCODRAFT_32020 [Trametes coccinea BRFM310]
MRELSYPKPFVAATVMCAAVDCHFNESLPHLSSIGGPGDSRTPAFWSRIETLVSTSDFCLRPSNRLQKVVGHRLSRGYDASSHPSVPSVASHPPFSGFVRALSSVAQWSVASFCAPYKMCPFRQSRSCTSSPSNRMDNHQSRPIAIPLARSSRRRYEESDSVGLEHDAFDPPRESTPSSERTSDSPEQNSSSGSSLLFAMDAEQGARSRRVTPPEYQLPPSTNASEPTRCTRCGRYFYANALVHNEQDRGPVCHECQHRSGSPRFPSRQQPGTLVATEFIPAWHRPAAPAAADVLQPTPGEHSHHFVLTGTHLIYCPAL